MERSGGHRRLRAALVALATFTLMAAGLPAIGQTYPDIVFPVVGEYRYSDTWGAARSGGRTHQGTDIIADKMTPVVAAAAGTVGWMHNEQGGQCCAMALRHDDGWESWYIHLNNDTPGTDDGQGWGFADGITTGVHVEAGQLIGWVGDSGNAEWTVSHLHFELHDPSGTPLNPYPALIEAEYMDLPRIAGTDRYSTAVAVSQAGFPDGASTVFLATGTGFADALTGGAAAGALDAPLLLTAPDYLPGSVRAEIQRLGADRVVLLGGLGAVSGTVADTVASLGVEVVRLAGNDRFGTAGAISQYAYPDGAEGVVIVNGLTAPDALSGSPAAGMSERPMLMVTADAIPSATRNELTRLGPTTIFVLGGEAVVSPAVVDELAGLTGASVERVAGADRYATSGAIARRFFTTPVDKVYLATGTGFADALAAGPLAASTGRPVILVSPTGANSAAVNLIRDLGPTSVIVIGGSAAVPKPAIAGICLELPGVCS